MTSPLVIDIQGLELTPEDHERLLHPLVGGVILFARNYHDTAQLQALTNSIKQLKKPRPLFISVDQEGGRVQRFKTSFTVLPSAAEVGAVYQRSASDARDYAKAAGFCMAAELIACGVDLSFAPVLDVNHDVSEVIGSRSFHHDPAIVIELASQYMQGMEQAGMLSVGKHFPGHGAVKADSHHELPTDVRSQQTINTQDLIVFKTLIAQKALPALMTAHIIYADFESLPVTFSHYWLTKVLRQTLGYDGIIFSDDLSMMGAVAYYPDILDRVHHALAAGCDYALICNDEAAVIKTLDNFSYTQTMQHSVSPITAPSNQKKLLLAAQTVLEKYRAYSYDH